MLKKYSKHIAVVVIISALALALPCSEAFAQPHGGNQHRDVDRGRGGDRHYYRDGRWYRHGWLGFDIAVSALVVGALIDALPPRHATIMAGGVPYYYYDNYYYRPYVYGGYIVVPPPMLVQPAMIVTEPAPITTAPVTQTSSQSQEALIINIPNSRN